MKTSRDDKLCDRPTQTEARLVPEAQNLKMLAKRAREDSICRLEDSLLATNSSVLLQQITHTNHNKKKSSEAREEA
jgi:hypothetical protein